MVLHNPNNWHWVNKDASEWAERYLGQILPGISAQEGDVSAKITKVISLEGDVDVNQRKGKVITLFDVKLKLEYEGKAPGAEDTSGAITIPEVAHDTEESEYVFGIEIYSETKEKQPVKDLVRAKIVPELRGALPKLGPALITEHGKDLQHTATSNPSSGAATPTWHPQRERAATPSGARSTTTSNTSKSSVNTTTVTASDEFRTTAEEMFQTFTDPQRIAAFTRGAPRVFEGAKPGGKFSIFDGNVTGEYVTLEAPKRIVQKWRLAQWPEGHSSTQELIFDQNDIDKVTNARVTWSGVPLGQEEVVKRNWNGYYIRSIKQTFGFGTIL